MSMTKILTEIKKIAIRTFLILRVSFVSGVDVFGGQFKNKTDIFGDNRHVQQLLTAYSKKKKQRKWNNFGSNINVSI